MDDVSCKSKFKEYGDNQGVFCPKCFSQYHYWLQGKDFYERKSSKTRQGLRSHIVMHDSHWLFRYWFISIHLMTSTKKSFSAFEFQRQLDHNRCEPIYMMLHKFSLVVCKRDELYEVELDEGFFSTEIDNDQKDKPLKRGRRSHLKPKLC